MVECLSSISGDKPYLLGNGVNSTADVLVTLLGVQLPHGGIRRWSFFEILETDTRACHREHFIGFGTWSLTGGQEIVVRGTSEGRK